MLGALAGACGGSPAAPVADVSSKTTTTTSASCLATGPPRRRGTAQRPAPGKSYSDHCIKLGADGSNPWTHQHLQQPGSQGHHGSVEPGATRRCQNQPSNHVAGAGTTSVVAEGHNHALFVPRRLHLVQWTTRVGLWPTGGSHKDKLPAPSLPLRSFPVGVPDPEQGLAEKGEDSYPAVSRWVTVGGDMAGASGVPAPGGFVERRYRGQTLPPALADRRPTTSSPTARTVAATRRTAGKSR